MLRIGLMSDTHSYLHPKVFEYFGECDEIWHAGDIGNISVADQLMAFKPFFAVYGNIDVNTDASWRFPLDLHLEREGLKVYMTHIGGYPGKYNARAKKILLANPPDLFISGHSHILKVMRDSAIGTLHINPGSCGIEGWHRVCTLIRFSIDKGEIKDLEVIELGKK
ncbi:MAG: metallophosphoesterase family protein [Saprospiraceae bacterium]